jgi:hypothetical protein
MHEIEKKNKIGNQCAPCGKTQFFYIFRHCFKQLGVRVEIGSGSTFILCNCSFLESHYCKVYLCTWKLRMVES